MPARYRTPDQVAYLKNESDITVRSDVFQLGLVLAELFTGKNPEKPSHEYTDPVELEPLGWVKGGLGEMIVSVISKMIKMNPADRMGAELLLDAWEGIFREAVERAYALEGRVF